MFVQLLLCVVLCSLLIYLVGAYNEHYWRKRGVKFSQRNRVLGPFGEFVASNRSMFTIFHDLYKQFRNEPAVGVGSLFSPAIYVLDPQNVQYVMQSPDFLDRAVDYNAHDYLADNVLFMSGIRWKLMRQKLTPLFTSTKLKNMFYILDKSAKDFVSYLKENTGKFNNDSFSELSAFCCAAIGNAVFGVKGTTEFDSPFLKMTRTAFEANFVNNIRFAISSLSPTLFKLFKLKFFKNYETFFIGAMKRVFNTRKEDAVVKHDFPDMCLSIQKSGVIKHEETGYEMEPTDELMAAQGFFFFIAGVEPTASALFAAMVDLGKRPEILKRVQEEVDAVFEKYNGNITYDSVVEMEYVDKVLNESMRLNPSIGFLTRRCTHDTVLPVGNIKIDKGTKVYTPIYEFHHDPKYFKDPELFNPDRFSDTKIMNNVTFQPFGYGSRICIGMRYARLQVKCGLAHILRNFDIKTITGDGGAQYEKSQVQVRLINVNVELVPRNRN